MTEVSIRDLASQLLYLIETGNGDKKVRVSVMYDNCEHIQNLNDVYVWNNWLILYGKKLGDD